MLIVLQQVAAIAGIAAVAAVAVGTLAPARAAHATTFEFERIDGDTTNINSAAGFALDATGSPHVVYAYDVESARYARKEGGAWTYERLDFAFFSEGNHPSVEIDDAGYPRVIYQANNVEAPMYVRRNAGAWTVEWPYGSPQAGMYNSLELDAQDYPHFTDVVSGLTYMIRYHRRVAAGWIVETVDFINDIGISGSSLALDANGDAHVTYTGAQNTMRYARRSAGAWTLETIDPTGYGVWAPIEIDASGNPCMAYASGTGIHYARRAGGAWTIETPFPDGPFGFSALSLALDSEGEPHLTYTRGFFEGDLYYARREGGVWTEEVVRADSNYYGYSNVLVLDASDAPHIVFTDGTAADLLYAHPPSVTAVGAPASGRSIGRMTIAPNPTRDGMVTIEVADGMRAPSRSGAARSAGAVEALVADASGRVIRRLRAADSTAGSMRILWDGRDSDGGAAPAGAYFVRLAGEGAAPAGGRVTIIR